MPIAFHMHLLTAFYMYLLRFTCIDCVLHVSTAFYMYLLLFIIAVRLRERGHGYRTVLPLSTAAVRRARTAPILKII